MTLKTKKNTLFPSVQEHFKEYGGRDLPVEIDEIMSFFHGQLQVLNMFDANPLAVRMALLMLGGSAKYYLYCDLGEEKALEIEEVVTRALEIGIKEKGKQDKEEKARYKEILKTMTGIDPDAEQEKEDDSDQPKLH